MKFGINFFPSLRPEDSTTADYYAQCIRLAERADALGYNSVKTVEHSFFDYGGHSPNPCVFLSALAARTKRVRPVTGAVMQIDFGGSTDAEAFRTLELIASQVMPRFN